MTAAPSEFAVHAPLRDRFTFAAIVVILAAFGVSLMPPLLDVFLTLRQSSGLAEWLLMANPLLLLGVCVVGILVVAILLFLALCQMALRGRLLYRIGADGVYLNQPDLTVPWADIDFVRFGKVGAVEALMFALKPGVMPQPRSRNPVFALKLMRVVGGRNQFSLVTDGTPHHIGRLAAAVSPYKPVSFS